jgi:hypothetical protein
MCCWPRSVLRGYLRSAKDAASVLRGYLRTMRLKSVRFKASSPNLSLTGVPL